MRPYQFSILLAFIIIALPLLYYLNSQHEDMKWTSIKPEFYPDNSRNDLNNVEDGGVIMSSLNNATAKAELGRSTWKLLHTMAIRYPVNPTLDERLALKQFIYLLSRLYPCGECATEFQKILADYPPQTSSRDAASQWTCAVHNIVNKRLGKDEFDCSTMAEMYKCGCDEEETDTK